MISRVLAGLVEKNFEVFCVMEQRGFVSMKFDVPQDPPVSLYEYAKILEEFNRVFDEHQDCLLKYSEKIENRTREAALILDMKNDLLMEKFRSLKPWILQSRDILKIH